MIDYLIKYWTYIVAIATVLAYLFEKGRNIWIEQRQKEIAYNRLFTAIVKLYFSYIKHDRLYSESAPLNFPDEMYIHMIKHLDTFNNDIKNFKKSVEREADIIPEIMIETHVLFDAIDRIRIVDRMQKSNLENHLQISDVQNLAIKRAQFYAMKETYEEFFDDIILEMQKKTTTSKDFIKSINYFKTEEYQKEVEKTEIKTLRKYFDSISRQGLIPEKLYHTVLKEFRLE